MTISGEVLEFESPVDGRRHPLAVCATPGVAASREPVPLLLEVSPGAISDLPAAVALTEQIATVAARHGIACVVARPTGRGPGTVYQNYGEVDVLEAIEFLAARYPIDRDRISITGASMGGAATFYLASHYPDLFAAASPFCGYADYRLWEKPGGLTFPMRPWEEPSWRSRSAAFLAENLRRTPMWLIHGEWDRSVGGGVSVEHSRQMARRLAELGAPHRYTEVAHVGHDVRRDDALFEEVIVWLLEQRKDRVPERVSLVTYGLRHNRSAWVAIDQQDRSGDRSAVVGRIDAAGGVAVATENVRAIAIGPVLGAMRRGLSIDGTAAGTIEAGATLTALRLADGRWQLGTPAEAREKHRGQSGPFGDLFFDGTILVPGTIGSAEETFFNTWAAEEAATFYRARNGGVHRGGIPGQSYVDLAVVRDVDLSENDRVTKNLLCHGTPASNAVLRRYAGTLPVEFGADSIAIGDRQFRDPYAAILAVFPHPEHPHRYLAVHGAMTPDAITWGSHIDLALVPDYLAYARGEILDWGFFGNDWRPAE